MDEAQVIKYSAYSGVTPALRCKVLGLSDDHMLSVLEIDHQHGLERDLRPALQIDDHLLEDPLLEPGAGVRVWV